MRKIVLAIGGIIAAIVTAIGAGVAFIKSIGIVGMFTAVFIIGTLVMIGKTLWEVKKHDG